MRLENNNFNVPIAEELDGCSYKPLPHNYRYSRARKTIGNAFGILAACWRILLSPIRAGVESVEKYVCACLALHSYLRQTSNGFYAPRGFVDSESNDGTIIPGEWRASKPNYTFRPIRGSRSKEDCSIKADFHLEYFCSLMKKQKKKNSRKEKKVGQCSTVSAGP